MTLGTVMIGDTRIEAPYVSFAHRRMEPFLKRVAFLTPKDVAMVAYLCGIMDAAQAIGERNHD